MRNCSNYWLIDTPDHPGWGMSLQSKYKIYFIHIKCSDFALWSIRQLAHLVHVSIVNSLVAEIMFNYVCDYLLYTSADLLHEFCVTWSHRNSNECFLFWLRSYRHWFCTNAANRPKKISRLNCCRAMSSTMPSKANAHRMYESKLKCAQLKIAMKPYNV